MTGVIYARYSSDSQREESIEGQLRECTAYAERNGITVIGNYIDRAMSARTADRPDFQRMITDSDKMLFDVIIVWKLDRFSRDRYDSATYKHILKKNGVKVISATENITDSPEGILLESMLEGLSDDSGVRTSKGKPFRVASMNTVLKNRKYIGEYRYGTIVIPGKLPALIDEDIFERVQKRIEMNRRAPAKAKANEEYLLTTKLFCGKCERMLAGESGHSHTGEVYSYYKCSGAKRKQGCKLKPIPKRWIEQAVVKMTVRRVLQDREIDRIAAAVVALQDQENTKIASLQQQLKECEKAIENMLNAIEAGIITPSTKQRMQELEARRGELNTAIMQEKMEKPKFTKEQVTAWINRFKYGDPNDLAYQKQIIDIFVNRVYVYDNKLVLTYNYKDGAEPITLAEIEDAFGSDLAQVAPPTPPPLSRAGEFSFKSYPSFYAGYFVFRFSVFPASAYRFDVVKRPIP